MLFYEGLARGSPTGGIKWFFVLFSLRPFLESIIMSDVGMPPDQTIVEPPEQTPKKRKVDIPFSSIVVGYKINGNDFEC